MAPALSVTLATRLEAAELRVAAGFVPVAGSEVVENAPPDVLPVRLLAPDAAATRETCA